MKESKSGVLNPFVDWGFKHLFGTEKSKKNLIGFLNLLLHPDDFLIIDLRYLNNESIPLDKDVPTDDVIRNGQVHHHIRKDRHKPHQQHAEAGGHFTVAMLITGAFLAGFRLLLMIFFQQIIQRHTKQIGNGLEDRHIGNGFSPFPFGDGLVGVIQFFCQFQLGHATGLAEGGNIFCENLL